ncbi:MAG: hypothetical protein Q9220_004367 [cf. Caloplaca sp. 1 TL-2023]
MDQAQKDRDCFPVACRIETFINFELRADKAKSIPVFEDSQALSGFDTFANLPVDVVYGAWAKLLRSYVSCDTVSFGVLSSFRDKDMQDDCTERDPAIGVENARICLYHATSERRQNDWVPDGFQSISGRGFKEMQINTAIHLWAETRGLKPESAYSGGLLSGLDVVLNVGLTNRFSNMSLLYRSPSVGNPYAQSLARTFRTILIQIALDPGQDLRSIDVVSKEDKERIRSWNPSELYASTSPLHELIVTTALERPDHEAVCAWDGSLTYAELDTLSSNVARALIRAGVCLGDLIPFAFEKSLWTVVAILGILKAGAAFVPLLPTHPKARLKEIVKSIEAKLIVTSERYQDLLAADLGIKAFVVSAQTAHIQADAMLNVVSFPAVGPRDIVFVLFTSGSTGKPKGVVHEHGAMSSHAISHGEAMGYHDARVIQFAAYVFDISVLDMTTTLIFGGCVCIPSEEDRTNNLPEVMNRMKVDLAMLTPSFANLLWPNDVTTLRTLICIGECYKEEITRRWRGKIRLMNSYGPAEAQFTHSRYVEHDDETTRPGTIGPVMSTAIAILVDPDNHDCLVPIGAVGEMLIASTTLARGYLKNEDKTRSAFISNPAWAAELGLQDRIFYKTGDLIRYNIGSFDGQCDYVWRKDTQIKIRGQRVEAREIEHHLLQIPGLAACAVAFPRDGCFSGQLVAVVQRGRSKTGRINRESIRIDHDHHVSLENIRTHLSEILPDYAIPSECLTVKEIPLTDSYKIDGRMVEAWLGSLESRPVGMHEKEAVLATTALDEKESTAHVISGFIAEMVATRDAEQKNQLQGHDFVLQRSGIDSIQVMSLSMFVRKAYGVKIAMEIFHDSSITVRRLAHLIDRHSESDDTNINWLDLAKEVEVHTAELLESIPSKLRQPQPRHVFLTGASGYLGSGILKSLLSQPDLHVYTLMRCSATAEGMERLVNKAKSSGWWRSTYSSRLHIWPGDLTKPKLGLSNDHLKHFEDDGFQQTSIEAIVHNGARVHYNTDYHGLKVVNLHPTKRLLALLTASAHCSIFVYVSGGRRLTFEENDREHGLQASNINGYSQSKYVSESVVRNCMSHPTFASKHLHIVQPGYIIGSPSNGIANLTDFIWRLVAGCLEIGAYNEEETSHWLFIADVDRVAEAITQPLFCPDPNVSHSTNRIRDGIPFSALWNLLQHEYGYSLHAIPQTEWLSRLEATVLAAGSTHMLFPLLGTLEKTAGNVGAAQENVPLEVADTSARVLDAIRANTRYLIAQGFFPPPLSEFKQQQPTAAVTSGRPRTSDSEGTSDVASFGSSDTSLGGKVSSAGTSPVEEDVGGDGCAKRDTAT